MRRAQVTIDRGPGNCDQFTGNVLGETTTHLLVTHGSNPLGEWFAKKSKVVNCLIKENGQRHYQPIG